MNYRHSHICCTRSCTPATFEASSSLFVNLPQGRFSGRLTNKVDEKALVLECRKLGPLLGGTTR